MRNIREFWAETYCGIPTVRVYNTTTQTLTNAVASNVLFNTEEYDRWGMHDTASNTDRITVVVPGIYLVVATVQFTANATGVRTATIDHFNSAATRRARISAFDTPSAGAAAVTTLCPTGLSLVAAKGDFFRITAYQESLGNLDLTAGTSELQHRTSAAAVWQSRG